ncbi:Uncharacterised protein [Bordetella pertussis]|nr:Uncharacterised protein [Bordetella pertussis]CFW39245.1 Uncharacterised protein [Bordetella pertussis]
MKSSARLLAMKCGGCVAGVAIFVTSEFEIDRLHRIHVTFKFNFQWLPRRP